MDGSKNFLLLIQLENEKIYVTKERRVLVFETDNCTTDFVIPSEKLEKIKSWFVSSEFDDTSTSFAILVEEDIKTDDIELIKRIKDELLNLTYSEVHDALTDIAINNYYVEQVENFYGIVVKEDLKKLLSYTSNGCFITDKQVNFLSHREIIEGKKFKKKGLIPLFKGEDYITFSPFENKFMDHDGNSFVSLDEVFGYVPEEDKTIEVTSEKVEEDTQSTNEENLFEEIPVKEEKLEVPVEEEKVDVDKVLDNIDRQIERLSAGIVKESSDEIEKEEVKDEETHYESENPNVDKVLDNEELEKLTDEINAKLEKIEQSDREIEFLDLSNNSQKLPNVQVKDNNLDRKQLDELMNLIEQEIEKLNEEEVVPEEDGKIIIFKPKLQPVVQKVKTFEEEDIEVATEKTDEKEAVYYPSDILSSITNTFENFVVNLNDHQKLVVEHLPYYELNDSFGIIQVPEIELNDYSLIPGKEIKIDKIKFLVHDLTHNRVDLIVKSAPNIYMENGTKLRKESHIVIGLNDEYTFKLHKNDAMETWTIRMNQATFERELRELDYHNILSLVSKTKYYPQLGNLEKYELQKTIMLFLNLVMKKQDYDTLDKLYKIIKNDKEKYEEFVTDYVLQDAYKQKDTLPSYEDKKDFLEKINFVRGLVDSNWLDYPRYIFGSHNYFAKDAFLKNYLEDLNEKLQESAFYDYLKKILNEYNLFKDLDKEGTKNLELCLQYLSLVYKHNPYVGENAKYKIEKAILIGVSEEDLALLISKICRRGIKEYANFREYETNLREKYRVGELKYPIYSEYFELEDIRMGDSYE